MRCDCGYAFTMPRFSLEFTVFDKDKQLAGEVFSCDSLLVIVEALRDAAEKLDEIDVTAEAPASAPPDQER